MLRLTVYIREPRCSSGTLCPSTDPAYEGSMRSAGTPAMAARALVLGASRPAGPFGLYGLGLFLGQHQRHSEQLVSVSSGERAYGDQQRRP